MSQNESATARLVASVAEEAGKMGLEVADVAGAVDEVSKRIHAQAESFGALRRETGSILEGTDRVGSAAQAAQDAAGKVHAEMTASRQKLDDALAAIGGLAA